MLSNNETPNNINDSEPNKQEKSMSKECKDYINNTREILGKYISRVDEQGSDDDEEKKDFVKMFYSDVIMSKLIMTAPEDRHQYAANPDDAIEILKKVMEARVTQEDKKQMIADKINLITTEDVYNMVPFFDKFDLVYSKGPGQTIMVANEELYEKDNEAMKASAFLALTKF